MPTTARIPRLGRRPRDGISRLLSLHWVGYRVMAPGMGTDERLPAWFMNTVIMDPGRTGPELAAVFGWVVGAMPPSR